jgi:hypothetical protein
MKKKGRPLSSHFHPISGYLFARRRADEKRGEKEKFKNSLKIKRS